MPKGSWREFEDDSLNNTGDFVEDNKAKFDKEVRVQRTRSGKSGKTVTIIRGLCLNNSELRKLLKKLKIKCGTGGTLKDQTIELQGDQIRSTMDLLLQEGFLPKQSGG